MAEVENILFKFGSTSVADAPGVDDAKLGIYAPQLAELHAAGRLLGIVSSGSVMAGKGIDPSQQDEQVLAALGSHWIVAGWERALSRHGLHAGQVLTTHHELDDPGEGSAFLHGFNKLHRAGIIPVVNENDVLSEEELKKRPLGGDNDVLTGHIAQITDADAVYIVTAGVRGLLRCNGKYLVRTIAADADHSSGTYSYDEALDIAGYREDAPENSMASKIKVLTDLAQVGISGFIGSSSAKFRDVLAGRAGTKVLPVGAKRVK